jgi:hypothetical protein
MTEWTEADRAALARLADEAAIRDLITRYASGLDWMDWPRVEATLWPDARADFGGMFQGDRAVFMPFLVQLEEGYTRRMHMLGLPRIALDGDSAQADCPSVTHFRAVEAGERTDNFVFGRYLLKCTRRAGEWRIAHMVFMLNAFRSEQEPNGDEGPLNLGDHTSPSHPLAKGVA